MFLFCCCFSISNRNSIHDFHTIIKSLCDKTTRIQCSDDVRESSVNIRIIQASAQLIFFSFSNKQYLNLLAMVQNESTSCRMCFFCMLQLIHTPIRCKQWHQWERNDNFFISLYRWMLSTALYLSVYGKFSITNVLERGFTWERLERHISKVCAVCSAPTRFDISV